MVVINIHRTKMIQELKHRFPKAMKPEDLVDVILAGKSLYALDSASEKPA